MTFQKTVQQLETLLEELESEDIDLDSAVDKYAKAVKLGGAALKQLNKIEDKVRVLKVQGDAVIATEML